MSDYKAPALMLPTMPKAKQLLADKGYDAGLVPRRPRQAPHPRLHSFENQPGKPRSPMTPCSNKQRHRKSETCSGLEAAAHPHPI